MWSMIKNNLWSKSLALGTLAPAGAVLMDYDKQQPFVPVEVF